jgi:hypothetical protein
MLKSAYIGASIAISWAWGTSLIMGMQIAQTKGTEAFAIWAFANCFTLTFFGILYKTGILTEKILEYRIVKWLLTLIQAFCLVVQLKILNDICSIPFGSEYSYFIVSGIGLFFAGIMYWRGLAASIFTDNFQGLITIFALLVLLGLCFYEGQEMAVLPSSSVDSLAWACWSACILMSGIISDLQHWQRAKVNGNGYAFEWATVFFAFYLSLVYLLAHYQFSALGSWCLFVAVLGVTTSTIDSIAVAMHKAFGVNLGTMFCFAICLLWGVFIKVGVLDLWSNFGAIRVLLAITMLYLGLRHLAQKTWIQ